MLLFVLSPCYFEALSEKNPTSAWHGDVVDENLVGSVIKSIHPWLSKCWWYLPARVFLLDPRLRTLYIEVSSCNESLLLKLNIFDFPTSNFNHYHNIIVSVQRNTNSIHILRIVIQTPDILEVNFPLFVENVMWMLDGCFLHIIATAPMALRWMRGSPRTECARRRNTHTYVARTNKNRVTAAWNLRR